ncbi:MAG TPA: toll/interleukin-1 receptor domain-containing protein [Saprospiraceae bacterium]|nr:toll/interleukin-1 receptor domain-containing protein [Saprospiraceae bacterium]
MSSSPSIYISHAWGGESEIITQQIVERFKKENLNITLDKNDLGYRESITKFMENLGQADAIVLVISNKYLHSEYCMFELLQIYDNKNILERIFPVVLDEVSIAKSTDRLELVKYWENQSTELETKIRELQSLGHIDGITDDLNLYYNIRNKIAKLTSILKDINTLNVGTHRDSGFNHLVTSVQKHLAKRFNIEAETTTPVIQDKIIEKQADFNVDEELKKKIVHSEEDKNKLNSIFKYLVMLALIVPVGFLISNLTDQKEVPNNVAEKNKDTVNTTLLATDQDNNPTTQEVIQTDNDNIKPNQHVIESSNIKPSNAAIISSPSLNSNLSKKEEEKPSGEVKPLIVPENTTKEDMPKASEIKKTYTVPTQYIQAKFPEDISSNVASKGQVVYLENIKAISSDSKVIIPQGGKIKCIVKDAVASQNGSVGLLSLQIESILAVNNEWMPLQFPVYSLKKREEIVFKKGQTIDKIKLPEFKISTN